MSRLAIYIDLRRSLGPVSESLRGSPWQVLVEHDGAGVIDEGRQLVPRVDASGAVRLEWPERAEGGLAAEALARPWAALFAASESHTRGLSRRQWLFPRWPADRERGSAPPRALREQLARVAPKAAENFDACVWLRVPIGVEGSLAQAQIRRVTLNCVTASNVSLKEAKVRFRARGVAQSFNHDEGKHVVAIRGVTGRSGTYRAASDAGSPNEPGRYRLRRDGIELTPFVSAQGVEEDAATVEFLVCDGETANKIQPTSLQREAGKFNKKNHGLEVRLVEPSRGGLAPLVSEEALLEFGRLQLASLVRHRGRLVTAADFELAARAFDGRIRDARVSGARAARTSRGVGTITLVEIGLARERFEQPDSEIPLLLSDLEAELQGSAVLGQTIRVREHE